MMHRVPEGHPCFPATWRVIESQRVHKKKPPHRQRLFSIFFNIELEKPAYATFTKIITSVNSTSDSRKAGPKISATIIPGRAAGLRPSESQAAPATFPCPSAARPAARAIAKPEVSATQFVVAAAPVVPSANAGTAVTDAIIMTHINITNFRIVLLLYELPPVGG